MSDVVDVLLELRDVGIARLPEAGDAGARRGRAALDRVAAGGRSWRPGWASRRIRIGGFALPPVAALAVVAAAAAATTAAVTLSATRVFQHSLTAVSGIPKQSVLSGSVRDVVNATIPGYGTVQYWAGVTQRGRMCEALRLPDGTWANDTSKPVSGDGHLGGAAPWCARTRQRVVVQDEAPVAGRPITGLMKEPLDYTYVEGRSDHQYWEAYVGYVTAAGIAAVVHDPTTGASAHVTRGGYFILVDRPVATPNPGYGRPHGGPKKLLCFGCSDLEVLNATGRRLKPDYTYGRLLRGYTWGPTKGTGLG